MRKAREAVLSVLIEAQLTKAQILELYLNRIYLSAGVYGVEAMSRRVFGKPAKDADAGRERAHRRPGAGAGGAVAVVEPRRRARAQPRRAGADARGGLHHRGRRSATPGARRSACGRTAATSDAPARLRQGLPAPAVPRHVRRRPSARLAGRHHLRRGAAGGRRARRSSDGLGRLGQAATCRRRWSRSIRHTGDVLALVGGRDYRAARRSTAPPAAAASRARPSSRSLFAAALERGFSPVSMLRGLDAIAAAGPRRVDAAQRRATTRPTR